MIPISRKQKLKTVINGVTYICRPPIGDLEIEIMNIILPPVHPDMRKTYDKIEKALTNAERRQNRERREALITERVKEALGIEDSVQKRYNDTAKAINLFLCGWESTKHKLHPFPKEGEEDFPPSSMLTANVRSALFTWYWAQFNMDLDEVKN